MKTFSIALRASLSKFALADKLKKVDSREGMQPQCPVIPRADPPENRIRLVHPRIQKDESATLWCYPATEAPPINYLSTDAKRVKINHEVFIRAAYHVRVRLVSFRDSKLIKDYSTYSRCHSADKFVDLKLPNAGACPRSDLG